MLELSPAQMESLIELTEARALKEQDYVSQGIIRELKDILQDAYDYWRRERDKFDLDIEKEAKND